MEPTKREQLKEVGQRFFQFRSIIGKNLEELAVVLHTQVQDLKDIEDGKTEDIFPTLEYLDVEYGINFHWLLTGEQNMFFIKGPQVPQEIFDLVTLLPWAEKKCDIAWITKVLADPHQKEEIMKSYTKFVQIGNAMVKTSAATGRI